MLDGIGRDHRLRRDGLRWRGAAPRTHGPCLRHVVGRGDALRAVRRAERSWGNSSQRSESTFTNGQGTDGFELQIEIVIADQLEYAWSWGQPGEPLTDGHGPCSRCSEYRARTFRRKIERGRHDAGRTDAAAAGDHLTTRQTSRSVIPTRPLTLVMHPRRAHRRGTPGAFVVHLADEVDELRLQRCRAVRDRSPLLAAS